MFKCPLQTIIYDYASADNCLLNEQYLNEFVWNEGNADEHLYDRKNRVYFNFRKRAWANIYMYAWNRKRPYEFNMLPKNY